VPGTSFSHGSLCYGSISPLSLAHMPRSYLGTSGGITGRTGMILLAEDHPLRFFLTFARYMLLVWRATT